MTSEPEGTQAAPGVTRWRTRGTEITAIQFTGANVNEIWDAFGAAGIYGPTEKNPDHLILTTTGGECPAYAGDWITPGSYPGVFRCWKPGEFAAAYEPVVSLPSVAAALDPANPVPSAEALRAYLNVSGWTRELPGPEGSVWSRDGQEVAVPSRFAPGMLRGVLDRVAHAEGRAAPDVARSVLALWRASQPAKGCGCAPLEPGGARTEADPGADASRDLPMALAGAQERAGVVPGLPLAGCPTSCDADCELNPDGCHESHDPVHMRWHDPGWSCGEVQRAIAEAVSAERERAEAAEARLAALQARCLSVKASAAEGVTPHLTADVILAIIGSEEEARNG